MNLFITTPLVLLVILATLYYLVKVKNENLGSFFKWSGYLVLLVATALLVCLIFRGARKMTHKMRGADKGYMHQGINGGKNMKGGCSGMADCRGMDKMNCGPGSGMDKGNCCACCGDMDMNSKGQRMGQRKRMKSESTTDTIDGKIINKEIEIIEK